jgi:MFS transporter, SP family, general alpha glucoside:H+ symporter
MDIEKHMDIVHLDQPADSNGEAVAHLANQEDHEQTRTQAIRKNPWAFAWCMFAVWLTLLVSFENQASGIVIGIPQFRKDFGYFADGNYVLSAKWQAAFSGGPVAS